MDPPGLRTANGPGTRRMGAPTQGEASLLTWLVYGAYLHARVARGWVGRRASWLLMAAFGCVLLTFFGNLFFGGLHSNAK